VVRIHDSEPTHSEVEVASVSLAVSELANIVSWLARRDPNTAEALRRDEVMVEITSTETGIGTVTLAYLQRWTPDGWQRDESSKMNVTNYDLW
jgi:hypothetical protein